VLLLASQSKKSVGLSTPHPRRACDARPEYHSPLGRGKQLLLFPCGKVSWCPDDVNSYTPSLRSVRYVDIKFTFSLIRQFLLKCHFSKPNTNLALRSKLIGLCRGLKILYVSKGEIMDTRSMSVTMHTLCACNFAFLSLRLERILQVP